jgi:hypothetical protein
MKRIAILAISVAALALAGLCNAFYTDLKVGLLDMERREFLFSWPASAQDRTAFVDAFAQRSVVPEKTQRRLSDDYSSARAAHADKYCTWRARRDRNGELILSSLRSVCSREFQWSGSRWETIKIKGTTYAEGQELAKQTLRRRPLVQGFTPSLNISDPRDISQAAITRAFWFGLVLPIMLAVCSVFLFLLAVRGLWQRA